MAKWQSKAGELFLRAAEIELPKEREDFLDSQCAGDMELRRQVEGLLRVKDQAAMLQDSIETMVPLNSPNASSIARVDSLATMAYGESKVGDGALLAGRYQLLEEIGQGGMGTVWLAEQKTPLKRRVAVKLVKAGMDSRQVLARFDAERQALALMDHPHIAKVFDGGITSEGRPFFVMEFVRGVPVTEYCDLHKLTLRERLELFLPICQAIQHAHQKGVIHRDIKPSNILVSRVNDQAVPKVIDFGLAKAMGASLTDLTMHTGLGVVVGTAEYMSPEQATLNNLDVDTRSDVYSLGVLLYELLTGSPPFSAKEFLLGGWMELLRVVREDEPPRPSTKLSSSETLPQLSANRRTDPKSLAGLLRNELDWVVMKSLEKDRTRRYESASSFEADIRRFLAGEAILAHPPSASYRFRKFAKKHRGQLIAVALVVLMLGLGIVGTSVGLVREARQRTRAEAAELATLEDFQATTSDVLSRLLISKEKIGKDEEAFLKSLMARWERFADRQGSDEQSRRIRAMGNYRVGHIQMELGAFREAESNVRKGRDLMAELAKDFPNNGKYQQNSAMAENTLAVILGFLGRPKEALAAYQSAHRGLQKLCAAHPMNTEFQLEYANALNASGLSALDKKDAEEHYRAAIEIAERVIIKEPKNVAALYRSAQARGNLTDILSKAGRKEEAEKEHRESQRIWKLILAETPDSREARANLATSHLNFCVLLGDRKKLDEAESQCELGLNITDELIQEYPAHTGYQGLKANLCLNLGDCLYAQDKAELSIPWSSQAIEIEERLREKNPATPDEKQLGLAAAYFNRALAQEQLKHIPEAISDLRAAIQFSDFKNFPAPRAQLAWVLLGTTDALDESLALAEPLTKLDHWLAHEWYNFACIYARASGQMPEKRQAYGDIAMELLRRSNKKSFALSEYVATDPDLNPLREREDFKAFVAGLPKVSDAPK